MDTALRVHGNLTDGENELKRGKHLIGQILTFSIPVLVNPDLNRHHSMHHFLRTKKKKINEMFKYCITEYRKAEKLNVVILGIDTVFIAWENYIK